MYNTLWRPEDAVVAFGTISKIRHPELGRVRRVDATGLDYTIILDDGTELFVNAEEEPGRLWERTGRTVREVSDWRFVVEFSALAELMPA